MLQAARAFTAENARIVAPTANHSAQMSTKAQAGLCMPKNSGGTGSVTEMNTMMHHGAKSP